MRWPAPISALLLVGIGFAFLPAALWVAEIWLGHMLGGAAAGLLTVPICFVLAWLATRRPGWSDRISGPDRPGATVALIGVMGAQIGALVWAGSAWDALLISGLLLPAAIWIWLWGARGHGLARGLTFPVAFAAFALPWEYFLRASIDTPLQAWTADIALQGLRLAGYPMTYWNTYTIMSPEYYVIVNETCSGMNMLITLSMYTLIFGWLVQPRMVNRLLLLGLVFPLAMLANGVSCAGQPSLFMCLPGCRVLRG